MTFPDRRAFLQTLAATSLAPPLLAADRVKSVAAAVTVFRPGSHAETIVGRWLAGYDLSGTGEFPRSRLVSLYVDQSAGPKQDIGPALAEKAGAKVYPSLKAALCQGGDTLAVDGVLLVAEHGKYPKDELDRDLYPRRRFMAETLEVFAASDRVVPVFADKHLAANWDDAKWVYDHAVEAKVPLMAGSSVPGAWRFPAVDVPDGAVIESAVITTYGPMGAYGFHALEGLQVLLERRKGGETGVTAVTCVSGPNVWKSAEQNRWNRPLLDAVWTVGKPVRPGPPEKNAKNPWAFLIEYRDGLNAAVICLGGHYHEWGAALKLSRQAAPLVLEFRLQENRPWRHFEVMARQIDTMILTGTPPRPVERTLLTTGILDAAIRSHHAEGKRLETPHLGITYRPGPAWRQPPGTADALPAKP